MERYRTGYRRDADRHIGCGWPDDLALAVVKDRFRLRSVTEMSDKQQLRYPNGWREFGNRPA